MCILPPSTPIYYFLDIQLLIFGVSIFLNYVAIKPIFIKHFFVFLQLIRIYHVWMWMSDLRS